MTDFVRWNSDGRGWHQLIAVLPLLLGDNQVSHVTPYAVTGNTEHCLEHSPDEKLNQKVIKPLDQLQLIVNRKGQIHISTENAINQNQPVDNSPGQKNGSLFIPIKWYDPWP